MPVPQSAVVHVLPAGKAVTLFWRYDNTCAGVAAGFTDLMSAATPATCGVAIEVPLNVVVAVEDVYQSDLMF